MENVDVKMIVQWARYKDDYSSLYSIPCSKKQELLGYLRKLEKVTIYRQILKMKYDHNEINTPKLSPTHYPFSKPNPSDPLLNVSVDLLTNEFINFLEKQHYVIAQWQEKDILLTSFEDLNYDELFLEFLREKYDDKTLGYRWNLVKGIYNHLKEYYNPFELRDIIITNKIPLELRETLSSFSDKSKDMCLFCGREITHDHKKYKEIKRGYADFAKQRPQTDKTPRSGTICPICLFSACISLIRTSHPFQKNPQNLVLQVKYGHEPYEAIFNRLLGISIGSYFTLKNVGKQIDRYGKTAITNILASTISTEITQKCNVVSNFSTGQIDKKKILAIKAFEEVLGRNKMYRYSNPKDEITRKEASAYRKAHYEIIKGNYFNVFPHLGILLQNDRKRKDILEKGIYNMVKWRVIDMDESKMIFGTALLIDSFLPSSWQGKEADKTEARKVAYYLEEPEEVLYRLRGIMEHTKKNEKERWSTTLWRHFSNEASYKLLKELLHEIYEKENYGNFNEKIKTNEKGQEYMLLSLDDVLKVYIYIRDYIWGKFENEDERAVTKSYSDFISKIKYALVARRPELLGGE